MRETIAPRILQLHTAGFFVISFELLTLFGTTQVHACDFPSRHYVHCPHQGESSDAAKVACTSPRTSDKIHHGSYGPIRLVGRKQTSNAKQ